jgi:hypothetical protein
MTDTETDAPIRMDKWMAPSRIRFFKRDGLTAPSRTVIFRLENQLIADIIARTFEPASRDSYLIMVKAPMLFSQRLSGSIYKEEELLGAEKEIEQHERLLDEFLDTRTEQARQRLVDAGHDPATFKRRFKQYEAAVVTNFATNLLDLYMKADYLYTLHASLWLLGELADSTAEANRAHRAFEHTLKRHLHAYSAALTKHAGNIQRLMDRLRDERREFQQAQSARDKGIQSGEAWKELELTEEGKAAAEDRKNLKEAIPDLLQQLENEVGAPETKTQEVEALALPE